MVKKIVVLDDFDGKMLEDADPDQPTVVIGVDRKDYNLWLSDANKAKLDKALAPFIDGAEEVNAVRFQATRTSAKSTPKRDPEQTKAIRLWAQEEGLLHNGKPLADRGRIPEAIEQAYNEAH